MPVVLKKRKIHNSPLDFKRFYFKVELPRIFIDFPIDEVAHYDFSLGATEEIWDELKERIVLTSKLISENLDTIKPQVLNSYAPTHIIIIIYIYIEEIPY